MNFSPKTKRNISRILPFGLIWLVTGSLFLLIETAATGNRNLSPETAITLTIPVFIFASIAVTIVGLIVGAVEIIFLENLFKDKSFFVKILYKMALYAAILFILISITFPIAASLENTLPIFGKEVWDKYLRFLFSITFISTSLQLGFQLFISLLYAGISENLGHAVLYNFFTGRYHNPKEEKRVFMFLDMKSSTAIAERLGHVQYFAFLQEYYDDLSEAIINHSGEVYQYIGDEVVVSWTEDKGLGKNNCIRCFFKMKKDLSNRLEYYSKKYHEVPDFKAGLHIGEVTTGEIGALKKEIIFSGDVLNATSRIQGLCNEYGTDLLISEELMKQLNPDPHTNIRSIGKITLKGRTEPMGLFSIQ